MNKDPVFFHVTIASVDKPYTHAYHRPFVTEDDWELFTCYIESLGYTAVCNYVSNKRVGEDYDEWF